MILTDLAKHFVLNDAAKTAACKYCQKILSFKTTLANLKVHLLYRHKDAYRQIQATLSNRKLRREKYSPMWEHYVRLNRYERIAQCKYCQKIISYKTTITNLKSHLRNIHEAVVSDDPLKVKQTEVKSVRNTNYPVWNYFKKNPAYKTAECLCCGKHLSYKTTITNLKQHLLGQHTAVYEEMCKISERPEDMREEMIKTEQPDEEAEESLKITDIWNYFEEDGEKARCVVCRATLGTNYEELKAHLKENHPKLLLKLMQDKEDNSDAASNNADDENLYTEIVYLEQDAEDAKPKTLIRPVMQKRRERRCSTPQEIFIKKKKPETEDDAELSSFIKYITCLLKKLPPDAFSKVQVEIINTILKANTNVPSSSIENSPRIILNNELSSTSVPNILSANDVSAGNNALLTHNYTITLASKDCEQENS